MKGTILMMPKNLVFIIFLEIVFLFTYGCSSFPNGGTAPGRVSHVLGELRSVEEASLDRTWEAVQKAMEDLEFIVTRRQKDALTAHLIARGANDKKIAINLKKISEGLTKVMIRIGTLGDKSLSLQILEKIKHSLGIHSDTAAAETAAYGLGELRSLEQASLERTWQAAQKAVENLDFTITSRLKDPLSAHLIARGANDKKIEINLKKASEDSTEVRIRIGILGDEMLSRQVLEKLKKNLFF